MEVVNRLLRTGQILEHRMDRVAEEHGLSHKGDLDVLTALRRIGPPYELPPSRLARAVRMTSGGMTNRLDRLETADMVSRRPDPSDRRGVLVGLTEKGAATVVAALDAMLSEQTRLLDPLDDRQRSKLAETLEQLLVALGDQAESRVSA